MLNIKKILAKILSWEGLKYTWDVNTTNTTDTWVPVFTGRKIQHRVIPSDASASATNTNTSKWTGGSILLYRK